MCNLRVWRSWRLLHVRYTSGWVAQNASTALRAQHACHFGKRAFGVAEAHRAVVAEHDVERVRPRTAASRRSRARVARARRGPRSVTACAGVAPRDRSRPVARAPARASAADHCAPPQPSSNMSWSRTSPSTPSSDSGRRHAPHASGRGGEVGAVDFLVRVRVRIPELPVPGDVVALRGLRHRPTRVTGDESHPDDMPRAGAGIPRRRAGA